MEEPTVELGLRAHCYDNSTLSGKMEFIKPRITMCTERPNPRLDYWGDKCSELQSASEHATWMPKLYSNSIFKPQPAEMCGARLRAYVVSRLAN